MSHPFLALFHLGGAELLLILVMLLVIGSAVVAAIAFLVIQSSRNKPASPAQSQHFPTPPLPVNDLEKQLTELANLKAKGLITEEEFNAKKKVILGL